MSNQKLLIKQYPGGICPSKNYRNDAGWDLYSPEDFKLNSKNTVTIDLKIAVTVPFGTYGRIAPRSGLAFKHSIDVLGGVIDRNYTDTLHVCLINHGNSNLVFQEGTRIAQLIITKIEECEIEIVNELTIDSRGGGLGSSGI